MRFYYTNSPTYDTPQTEAKLSLGGFLSSSLIQNDLINNLFSSISELSRQSLRREAILIALKNTYTEVIQDVTLEFKVDDFDALVSEFSIAFIVSKTDSCGNVYFDRIDNSQALPFVDLEVISDLNKSFSLGDFAVDQVIGIWLIRNIIKANVAPLTNAELEDNYNDDITPATQENFSLELSWTSDESGSDSV